MLLSYILTELSISLENQQNPQYFTSSTNTIAHYQYTNSPYRPSRREPPNRPEIAVNIEWSNVRTA